MPGLNVGRDALTRRSDRFASPADRRELRRGRSARWRRSCRMFPGIRDVSPGRSVAETEGRLGDPGPAPAQHRARDLALFNLAIDSKLRGCDLVRLQVDDVCAGGRVRDRATIIQKKTGRPVQFEITEQTRAAIEPGFPRSRPGMDGTSSQAAFRRSRTYRPGSMRGSSMPGSRAPGSTARPTARIRCGERRRPRFTRRRAICGRFSCCLGIRSSKARSAISASRSMTR